MTVHAPERPPKSIGLNLATNCQVNETLKYDIINIKISSNEQSPIYFNIK